MASVYQPISMQCPSCSSPLQQEAFDHNEGFVKCAYCGSLMTQPRRGQIGSSFRPRPSLTLPPGMDLKANPHGVVIERRWFSAAVLLLIPFCLVWNGFLIAWYGMATKGAAPTAFLLLPLIHVAVGVGLTYFTAASLINRTHIRVEQGELTITHGPLPWFGYKKLPGVVLDQLYAKSHVTHGKHGPKVDYQVWAAKSDGKHEKILGQSLTTDQALYIEQQIEAALGIKDRAMAGELPR